jgi:hypothetical protein
MKLDTTFGTPWRNAFLYLALFVQLTSPDSACQGWRKVFALDAYLSELWALLSILGAWDGPVDAPYVSVSTSVSI